VVGQWVTMPEQKQEKQAPIHGGDDDIVDDILPPKLKLTKFASKPDVNLRDVFWEIMGLYATKKEIPRELIERHKNSRMGLIRISVSTIVNPEGAYYGLSVNFTALYTLMLLLDEDWEDAFMEFLSESYEVKKVARAPIVLAINKLSENSKYKDKLLKYLSRMIRDRYLTECTTAYVSDLSNKEFIQSLKKELLIIAKSDIEQNQYNAINALTAIKDDEIVQTTLISLLNHWDEEARKMAAMILSENINDKIVRAAQMRERIETNEEIKKILLRIMKKGEKNGDNKST